MSSVLSEPLDIAGEQNSTEIKPLDESSLGEFRLLRELTHRTNNELASTMGFLSWTSARSADEDVQVALAGVIEHINGIARIYRALQMPVADNWIDAEGNLRELCQAISGAKLKRRGIELLFIECPLQLSASRCWRLGMIVSELITNASRHAFRDSGGKIQVGLLNCETYVECIVTDNGFGSENIKEGQGMKIVQSLVHDLRGRIDHRSGPMGTRVMLSFPLGQAGLDNAEALSLKFTNASPQ
jgi:two-component sensor histidine kinase